MTQWCSVLWRIIKVTNYLQCNCLLYLGCSSRYAAKSGRDLRHHSVRSPVTEKIELNKRGRRTQNAEKKKRKIFVLTQFEIISSEDRPSKKMSDPGKGTDATKSRSQTDATEARTSATATPTTTSKSKTSRTRNSSSSTSGGSSKASR